MPLLSVHIAGEAARVSAELEQDHSQQVMAVLFLPGQTAAKNTYLAAISSYPPAPAAPAGIVIAQARAVDQWWAGTDPAGQQTA